MKPAFVAFGVDPGANGAVAAIYCDDDGKPLGWVVQDAPTCEDRLSGRVLDAVAAVGMIAQLVAPCQSAWAALEHVNSWGGEGARSSFTFGVSFGVWQASLAGLSIPTTLVLPRHWQASYWPAGRSQKADAIPTACRLLSGWGFAADDTISLKKHLGRADALLLAAWARAQQFEQ